MDGSDTSLSLPSPRRLAGTRLDSSPRAVMDSPTLVVRTQQNQNRGGALPECSSPLFLGEQPSSPSPASPRPTRVRRPRLTAQERAEKQAERVRALAERQRWRDANRIRQRRADTMQDLHLRIDASLVHGALAPVMSELREKIEADGAQLHTIAASLTAQTSPAFGRVAFERKVRSEYDAIQKLWAPLDEEHTLRESTLLHICTAAEFLAAMEDQSLVSRIQAPLPTVGADVLQDGPPRHVLVLLGLDTHLKQRRTAQNRAYTESIRQRMQSGGAPLRLPSEESVRAEIDRVLLQLQMLHACHVVRIPALSDAVDWLHSIACDVSIRPYKLLERASTAPIRASRTITGTSNLATFQGMLEQIPRCTAPATYAITAVYPTFRALMEAYAACTPEQGAVLLAPLEVRGLSNAVPKRTQLAPSWATAFQAHLRGDDVARWGHVGRTLRRRHIQRCTRLAEVQKRRRVAYAKRGRHNRFRCGACHFCVREIRLGAVEYLAVLGRKAGCDAVDVCAFGLQDVAGHGRRRLPAVQVGKGLLELVPERLLRRAVRLATVCPRATQLARPAPGEHGRVEPVALFGGERLGGGRRACAEPANVKTHHRRCAHLFQQSALALCVELLKEGAQTRRHNISGPVGKLASIVAQVRHTRRPVSVDRSRTRLDRCVRWLDEVGVQKTTGARASSAQRFQNVDGHWKTG